MSEGECDCNQEDLCCLEDYTGIKDELRKEMEG